MALHLHPSQEPTFDLGLVELVYETEKNISKMKAEIADLTKESTGKAEELRSIKRFTLDTKALCVGIVESLEIKLQKLEKAVGNSLQYREKPLSNPAKAEELSLETHLKSDLSYLNQLVRKNIEDQQGINDAFLDMSKRIGYLERKTSFSSPLSVFREQRDHSLSELREKVAELKSNSSLRSRVLSVSYEEPKVQRSNLSETHEGRSKSSISSAKPPKSHRKLPISASSKTNSRGKQQTGRKKERRSGGKLSRTE